jgi:hypothetical protein
MQCPAYSFRSRGQQISPHCVPKLAVEEVMKTRELAFLMVFCILSVSLVGEAFTATKNTAKSEIQPIPERRYLRGDELAATFVPSNKHPSPSSVVLVNDCEGSWTSIDPSSFHKPEVKVAPGGSRTIYLKIYNVGNVSMTYTADALSSEPGGCITGAFSGTLDILTEITLPFTISGAGVCEGTFIRGSIEVTMCDGAQAFSIPVHAISALDYYECPVDPVTYNTVETENNNLRVYVCANSLEWIEDKDLIDPENPGIERVFSRGGPFVATTIDGNKVVGRFYGDNDFNAGVRDKLYTDLCDFYIGYDCYLLYTKNIYMIIPPDLPVHCWWGWWEWHKDIRVCDIPGNRKIVVNYIRLQRHDPPTWWPALDPPQVFTGYDNVYAGIMMDLDCPGDDNPVVLGEVAPNYAGYDDVNHIAWQKGYYNPDADTPHPEYDNYYAGIALGTYSPTAPYAAHNILNAIHLYPQDPWGWLDEDLYDIASTAGTTIEDDPEYHGPDVPRDRSVVMTAIEIPAGTNANADYPFVVIEAMTPDGLADLQALIAEGRLMVHEIPYLGFPVICGDVNGKDGVNMGDAICLLSYLFKGGAPPLCPMNRADVNSNGMVNLGDVVYLLGYLFKGQAEPNCPGIPYSKVY